MQNTCQLRACVSEIGVMSVQICVPRYEFRVILFESCYAVHFSLSRNFVQKLICWPFPFSRNFVRKLIAAKAGEKNEIQIP